MAASPWRVALVASSSWSHSFLTEKNWQLWPDVAADRRPYDALAAGDYDAWRRYTTDRIEDSGQHEVLNWFCLLGAMEALGRTPDRAAFRRIDRPEIEAFVVPGGNFPTMPSIAGWEREFGKPVVTTNQASFWAMLVMLKTGDRIPGFGRLLAEAPAG